MSQADIGEADTSNLDSAMEGGTTKFSVPTETTDGADGQKEYTWQMQDWNEHLGYYKNIPELRTAVDAKANWIMGAGYEADEATTMLLDTIKGHGKDTFNSILRNMQTVKTIAGDSFAEIIRDKKGQLINIKTLDPSTIAVVHNKQGIVQRYEQVSKVKKPNKRFQPNEMFHLSRNRIADEVHGISIIPAVKWIIDARNESMADWKRVLHRNVAPVWIYHLDTDSAEEIAAFKATQDKARANAENIYVPKGVVEPEQMITAQNATLNPLAWIEKLNDYFFQVVNVPQIIVGNAKEFTDASGKIVYLAFEQSVKGEQLYIEEQVLAQLNLEIFLTFPASLQQELISDTPAEMELEEEGQEPAAQPNDTTEEVEGKT